MTISEVLCCTGIGHNVWPFLESVRSLTRPLNINRDPNTDEVYIGTTTVTQCDIVNNNGVVHSVDKVSTAKCFLIIRNFWYILWYISL